MKFGTEIKNIKILQFTKFFGEVDTSSNSDMSQNTDLQMQDLRFNCSFEERQLAQKPWNEPLY